MSTIGKIYTILNRFKNSINFDRILILFSIYDVKYEHPIEDVYKLTNEEVINLANVIINQPIVQYFEILYTILDKIPDKDLTDKVIRTLANKIGMIIPPNINAKQYYIDNVLFYNKVLTRNPSLKFPLPVSAKIEQLNSFTDKELFDTYKIYVSYFSRTNLISILVWSSNPEYIQEDFFIPLSNQCGKQSNKLLIAYGENQKDKYECFTVEQLLNILKSGDMREISTSKGKIIYTNRLEKLIEILQRYPKTKETTKLINFINEKYGEIWMEQSSRI